MTQSPFQKALLSQTPKGRYTILGGKNSNLLWTCACISPFLNNKQLFLHYFTCITLALQISSCNWPRNQLVGGFVLGFRLRMCLPPSPKHSFIVLEFWVPHLTNFLRRAVLRFWHILKAAMWHYPSPCKRLVFSLSPSSTNLSATVTAPGLH